MSTEINFDSTTVDPTSPFNPLPNGTYRMHIVESEVKPTKDNQGRYLQLTWQVLDGEHKGKKVWDRLNIVNNNATAKDIAQRALSAICHATGVLKLSNSQQLHHKPVMVKVVVRQDSGRDPSNDVKGYVACEGSGVAFGTPASATVGAATAAAASTPGAPAPSAENVPAWARK
jgi:hypothetical protein